MRKRNIRARPANKRARLQCYKCPHEHLGWPRRQLRYRKKMFYCPEHLAEYDAGRGPPWPKCPGCGGSEFGVMEWGGDVESTTASCGECLFSARAVDHFEPVDIKILASPVVRARDKAWEEA